MATRALRKDAGTTAGDGPKHDHVFRDFGGINTQAARQAIKENEFAWIENVMPIGHGNAVVVPARGPSLQTVGSGTCYYMQDYNLDGANYMFMATDDGHAYQVALDAPYTRTTIGSAFSDSGLQIAQWENSQLLIVDPVEGYFVWDGTVLLGPGAVVVVTVTAGGSYTVVPTITFTGGGGAGAAASAEMQLDGAQTVTAAGTGYVVGDILTLVGGTFTIAGSEHVDTIKLVSVALNAIGANYAPADTITLAGGTSSVAAVLTVSTVNGGGGILTFTISNAGNYTVGSATFTQGATSGIGTGATFQTGVFGVRSVSVYDPGSYTVLPVAPVATTGGGNNGATITPAYTVGTVTVTNGGTIPYVDAPNVVFSSGAATADASIMQGPVGEHIATYSDRVWISKNRTLYYSAPDSYFDFSGTGSGNTIITDETLHSSIQQLISANGFLYFTGSHSINVIGNVQVVSGDTVFSNTNLSASVGSNQPYSLLPYFRSIWMANQAGIYSAYGSTPSKTSDPLDGLFQQIDFTMPISAGMMYLRNILCAAYLFTYTNPLSSVSRPLLAIFFNKKWFLANQGDDLVVIATGELADISNLYGTDGTSLYKLFADTDTPVDWLLSTAFWDMKDVVRDKAVTKFGFEFTIPGGEGEIEVSIDALASTPPFSSTEQYTVPVSSAVEWINDMDEVVPWVNNLGAEVDWLGGGYFMDMQDGSEYGKYIGLTMSSSDVRGSLNSMMLEYTFRVRW